MRHKITYFLLIFMVYIAVGDGSKAQTTTHPVRRSELLALVAGDAMPENVIAEIQSRGVSFALDSSYTTLLKDAGGDPRILAALNTAKVANPQSPESSENPALLAHLSHAGHMIKAKQFDPAISELTGSLATSNDGKVETGFVMGKILIEQQRDEEAGRVYAELLRLDPDFPELHTRLSYTSFNLGDFEEALQQAKAALARNPNNPVAHLNAGMCLHKMRNFDAAKVELRESIRSKPDYELAHAGLGFVLSDLYDYNGSIVEYKKALALKPDNVDSHNGLGWAYVSNGDHVSAIREYREAKRLDPKRLDVRQNLASALMHEDPAASITEFRELVAMAPDYPVCHQCLGNALYRTGRMADAEKEYRTAVRLDPTLVGARIGLGLIQEAAKNYDQALVEYRAAEKLDESSAAPFTNAGRVLLLQKKFSAAIEELKQSEEIDPTDWRSHDLRGEALEGSGDRDAAIAEYKEALSTAPKELEARLDLALALEKKGDWPGALENYRQAALDEPPHKMGIPQLVFNAQHKYASAKERFQTHLASLRSSGKSAEAAALESRLRERDSTAGLDEKYHNAMQASAQAVTEKRFEDAETSAKEAIAIAEKLQPQDGRLSEAVGQLANVYSWRMDLKNALDTYKRQLLLAEKVYGPQSPQLARPLGNMAMTAVGLKDFASAEALFTRAIEVNEKTYGENSVGVGESVGSHVSTSWSRILPRAKPLCSGRFAFMRPFMVVITILSFCRLAAFAMCTISGTNRRSQPLATGECSRWAKRNLVPTAHISFRI